MDTLGRVQPRDAPPHNHKFTKFHRTNEATLVRRHFYIEFTKLLMPKNNLRRTCRYYYHSGHGVLRSYSIIT